MEFSAHYEEEREGWYSRDVTIAMTMRRERERERERESFGESIYGEHPLIFSAILSYSLQDEKG